MTGVKARMSARQEYLAVLPKPPCLCPFSWSGQGTRAFGPVPWVSTDGYFHSPSSAVPTSLCTLPKFPSLGATLLEESSCPRKKCPAAQKSGAMTMPIQTLLHWRDFQVISLHFLCPRLSFNSSQWSPCPNSLPLPLIHSVSQCLFMSLCFSLFLPPLSPSLSTPPLSPFLSLSSHLLSISFSPLCNPSTPYLLHAPTSPIPHPCTSYIISNFPSIGNNCTRPKAGAL